MNYDVVLSDPPYRYFGSGTKWAAAEKEYTTLSDPDLLAIAEPPLTDRGVLFLWATSPRLDFAVRCIHAWGLHYRGVGFVWVKTGRDGVPWRARGVRPSIVKPLTEFVLLGSRVPRGRPMPLGSEAVTQTIFAPTREHSRKPDEVYERIEQLYPNATKLEMFARRIRSGWDSHGNEVSA